MERKTIYETSEKARKYIIEGDTFSDHADKHIHRAKVELGQLIKIYEQVIAKHKGHNWYPHNSEERAVMDAATKQLIKEKRQVIRAAKRLLELI